MKHFVPLTVAAGLLGLMGCAGPNDANAPQPAVAYAEPMPPPPESTGEVATAGGPSETVYVPPGAYASAPSYSQDDYDGPSGPVPEEGEVEVQQVADFDEPLAPYGDWVVVGNYGRCWRPRRVAGDWRPYCDGSWVDTDRGWYWQSDEPWGWATYHYGRWDYDASYGWLWVPHTRWAPAWVEWRTGGGYVGWAPLPPGARFNHGHEIRDGHAPDRNFVFVQTRRFGDHVRPTTVVINNTTVIHQTTNITNITIVNNRVHDEGPKRETIEKESGHTFRPVQAVQLRRQIETPVAKQHPVLTHPHTAKNPAPNTTNDPRRNGPPEPIGNPAHNSQPSGAVPPKHANDRVENRNDSVTHQPNRVKPTAPPQLQTPAGTSTHANPAATPRPSVTPAHLNPEMHRDLNAHPTLLPLHHDGNANTLRPSPTMKPLETRGNVTVVHPNAPAHPSTTPVPHAETTSPHSAVTQPATSNPSSQSAPQPRPRVPNQNPIIVPHSNEVPVNTEHGTNGRATSGSSSGSGNTVHPADHHDNTTTHTAPPVVHTKPAAPPPPPPPSKSADSSPNPSPPPK